MVIFGDLRMLHETDSLLSNILFCPVLQAASLSISPQGCCQNFVCRCRTSYTQLHIPKHQQFRWSNFVAELFKLPVGPQLTWGHGCLQTSVPAQLRAFSKTASLHDVTILLKSTKGTPDGTENCPTSPCYPFCTGLKTFTTNASQVGTETSSKIHKPIHTFYPSYRNICSPSGGFRIRVFFPEETGFSTEKHPWMNENLFLQHFTTPLEYQSALQKKRLNMF